jgi:hypothetical protein
MAGADHRVGACEHDSIVKDGLAPAGTLHIAGSMYRIGGVDFDKVIAFLAENPDRFRAHWFGQMSWEEFIDAYHKGEAIEVMCRYFQPGRHFQIYNNPNKGIMVGCINVDTPNLNGLVADDHTQAEYEVLKSASVQLERIKAEYPGFEDAFIIDVPTAGIRETRHIMGEYLVTIRELLTCQDFPDTIGFASHPVDVYPIPNECRDITPPRRAWFKLPYRCLVAKGVDNLLLAGRLISVTREASGCIRPTICCMVTGEAAGTAAAMLCATGQPARQLDTDALRARLKENNVKC